MSTKKELAAVRDQNKELRRTLSKLAPSLDARAPDRVWKLLGQYAEHFQYLASMTTPYQSRSVATMNHTRSQADRPPFNGTHLTDRKRDRTIWHNGRAFEREADRLYRQLQGLLDQSAAWVRGIDLLPQPVSTSRRDRCECGELQAISWSWCPHCGRANLAAAVGQEGTP